MNHPIHPLLHYNSKHLGKMLSLTDPLSVHLGIDTFWYYTLEDDGTFTYIGNCLDNASYHFTGEVFLQNDFFRAPDAFKVSYNLYADEPSLESGHNQMTEKFPMYHPLLVFRKASDGKLHGFGFASTLPHPQLLSLYLNRRFLIERFIDYFLNETQKLRKDLSQEAVNMAELRGKKAFFSLPSPNPPPITDDYRHFLVETGFNKEILQAESTLTRREREVLRAVAEGQTASESGNHLFISRRTVEHHIESLKAKFNCRGKTELRELGQLIMEQHLI